MTVRDVLFDLDGCLYAAGNGLEEFCRARIFSFMVEHLRVESTTLASEVWHVAFRRYNQSLRALRALGYQFDSDLYWRYIRQGSLGFLSPAPETAALLRELRQKGVRCWVMTNCREREALETLEELQIPVSLFEGVLGADFMGDVCKPELAAFEKVVKHTGCDPLHTAMFEDSLRNLVTAKALGMRTVLVGATTLAEEGPAQELLAATLDASISVCTLAEVRASSIAAALFS